MKYRGIQDFLKNVGESGCYILSILESIGISSLEQKLDMIQDLIKEGYLSKDLLVLDNDKLASRLGCTYKYTKIKPSDEKVYISEYFNERTKYTHFVLCVDGKDFDTLDSSVTVKEGYVRSYRIFKRK